MSSESKQAARVITPDTVDADESTPGVARKTIAQTDRAVMIESHIAAGTTSGWHHHGDRAVFGYVVEGSGHVEYGPSGDQRLEASAGDYFSIAPGVVHRDVTPDEGDAVVLVCFVGTGPVVVNVDGPST